MIEIRKAEKIIKQISPEFEFKKWNSYSIFFDEDMTRITVARRPNTAYKWRAAFIIPFTFIPYCFWFGFVNVKRAIRDSFKGCWVIGQNCEQDKYDIVKQYLIDKKGYIPKELNLEVESVSNDDINAD